MTLIDKETIRAEIERQIHMLRNSIMSQGDYGQSCQIVAYENILALLDTLPDEPNHLEEALELVAEYNLKPYRDGNAWCILLGKDIQSGICGFGDTLTETYLDFLKSYKEYKHPIGELLNDLPQQPVEGLEEEIKRYFQGLWPGMETAEQCNTDMRFTPPAIMRLARHFAEWGAAHLKRYGDED